MADQTPQDADDQYRRKQLIYRANHRGIKEMDIILGGYADAHVMTMGPGKLDQLEKLMGESDRDLLTWFTGEVAIPAGFDTPLFAEILSFTEVKFR